MLTAQPAAVRRTVGELDFRLATNAFNRTCGRKTPRAGGEAPEKLARPRETQPAPGPRGTSVTNNGRLSKARHKPQVQCVPERSANTRSASCLPAGRDCSTCIPHTRAEAPALEKLHPQCLRTGSVNDTVYSKCSTNKGRIMKSRERLPPTVTS